MLTLLEAAQHLRLADTLEQAEQLPDKALIEGLVLAATECVENYTGKPIADYAGAVPQSLKQAGLLLIGHLYANRESVVIGTASFANELPLASEYLMHPYRVYS